MADLPLDGKAAIVTGGGRGLGRAMALGLAEAGCQVIATAARENAEIDTVAKSSDRIHPVLADVTKPEDCARAVETAIVRFGRLDILVNNAGRGMKYVSDTFMTEPPKFWETDPDTWRMVIDTNVNGPFLMARAAAPAMFKAGWGRIINISMLHSTMQLKGFTPYGPSKAALESETIIWAQDLDGSGVTVNALLPGGPTLTGMIGDGTPQEFLDRLLDPAIMVPPLLWLASDASNGITGKRFDAKLWRTDLPADEAANTAMGNAGWAAS